MEENKKEKKQIKISLGTAICIIIIILLAAVLIGTVIYYNRVQEKNSIAQGENKIATEKEIVLDEIVKKVEKKYYTGSYFGIFPEFNDINNADEEWLWFMLRSYAWTKYENDEDKLLTYNEVEKLSKEFFGKEFNKKFPENGAYGFEKQEEKYNFRSYVECPESTYYQLAVKDIVKNKDNYEVTIVEYKLTYADILRLNEGDEGRVIISDLEGDIIKEYDYKFKTINDITQTVMYNGNKEIDEDYIDNYIIENSNGLTEKKLVISYDSKADDCYIESCEIISEDFVEEDKNNIEGNVNQLEDNKALIIEECVGKWDSEYAVDLQGEKVDLGDLLGSGYADYGSKLILNDDGTFMNEIQPIQSNEVSNTGTWEYKEKVKFLETTGAGIILKYTDGREETLQIWSSGEADTMLFYQYDEENEIHLTK